jgi:hypothetical protein
MRHACNRIHTNEPNNLDLLNLIHYLYHSVYGVDPHDAPEKLGKHVTPTHNVDANLMPDVVTGKSVTEILHLANKAPLDCSNKAS